jgi:hypothetical protein
MPQTSQATAGPPTPTKGQGERLLYLMAGLILGPPLILAIFAIALIATPFWSIIWVVRDNGPLDKSPKDWWDAIWDLIARRMIPAWLNLFGKGNSQADEPPDLPQAVSPVRVADRLRIVSQAQTTDHPH